VRENWLPDDQTGRAAISTLVFRHDATPVAKRSTFGVAEALGQALTGKTVFPGLARMVGTPLYMSPEPTEMSDLGADTRVFAYNAFNPDIDPAYDRDRVACPLYCGPRPAPKPSAWGYSPGRWPGSSTRVGGSGWRSTTPAPTCTGNALGGLGLSAADALARDLCVVE
jgi:hypothetical protein